VVQLTKLLEPERVARVLTRVLLQAADGVIAVMTGLRDGDTRLPPLGLSSLNPAATNLSRGSDGLKHCLEVLHAELTQRCSDASATAVVSAIQNSDILKAASVRSFSCRTFVHGTAVERLHAE
jgi:hypothetical protein